MKGQIKPFEEKQKIIDFRIGENIIFVAP